MGTVAYCSPEQVTRGNTDQRSDVYSAGIVLYELLTGQAPYVGDTAMAVAYQHVHSRVPAPSSQVAGIAPELDDLVVRATDTDPAGRPRDAGAFLAEVADVRTELNLPVMPVPARPRPNPNGNQPSATADTATAPDVGTTQRLAPGSGVHHTAVGTPPGLVLPAPPPIAAPRGPTGQSPLAPGRPKRRRGLLIIMLVFLLIGAAAGFTGWWLVAGRYTRVPSVGGEARPVALAALHRAGFNNVTISEVNDEDIQKGQAVGTRPGAGSQVRRHGHVTLLISIGPKLYEIPQLRGKSQGDARDALGALPIDVNTTQRFDDNVPKDHVIGTSPAAGTEVRAHTPVTLIVSSGPQLLTVPDVAGHNQDDATNQLQNTGFDVNVVQQFSDNVDQGTVISQDPGAGSQLEKGHTVTITVSKGSETVSVPDIATGTPVDQARKTLEDAGLKVKVQNILGGGGSSGSVFQLDPPSGTQVHRGDIITVYAF
jgi:eukaryotic-like serine/threonine-protein kinase